MRDRNTPEQCARVYKSSTGTRCCHATRESSRQVSRLTAVTHDSWNPEFPGTIFRFGAKYLRHRGARAASMWDFPISTNAVLRWLLWRKPDRRSGYERPQIWGGSSQPNFSELNNGKASRQESANVENHFPRDPIAADLTEACAGPQPSAAGAEIVSMLLHVSASCGDIATRALRCGWDSV